MAWACEKGVYLLENVYLLEELFPLVVERLLSPKAVAQMDQFLDSPAAAFGQKRPFDACCYWAVFPDLPRGATTLWQSSTVPLL